MNRFISNFVEGCEIEYERHPRLFFVLALYAAYLIIFIQSYFALPRSLLLVFQDTADMLLFIVPVSFVAIRLRLRNLPIFGLLYFALGIARAFFGVPTFIHKEYATIAFLVAIWFLGDWLNLKVFKKSLISELLRGNYYLAAGLILSTVVLGALVEFLNAPAGLWWYNWPFPSLTIFGVPVFLAAFGWFPWIFAMLVFLYPFALKRPRRFKNNKF